MFLGVIQCIAVAVVEHTCVFGCDTGYSGSSGGSGVAGDCAGFIADRDGC